MSGRLLQELNVCTVSFGKVRVILNECVKQYCGLDFLKKTGESECYKCNRVVLEPKRTPSPFDADG